MRLTIIGCTGSMSGPASAASSYLVQAEAPGDDGRVRTFSVVLDLGPGAMGQMLRYVDPADLDAVVISHCHADHMVDLVGMHVYRRWNPSGPLAPVLCLGPSDLLPRLRGVDGAVDSETYSTEFRFRTAVHGLPVQVGPLTITPFTALHPVEAFGYRIEGPAEAAKTSLAAAVDGGDLDRTDAAGPRGSAQGSSTAAGAAAGQLVRDGASMAFTGDTDRCESMDAMARGVDLLLAEAAFIEDRDVTTGMHMTGRRAGELAAQAGAQRLVLTHIQPWTDPVVPREEAAAAFTGPLEVAAPGSCWEL